MVGFIPRSHTSVTNTDGTLGYKYLFWWRVWWSGAYSIVLTKVRTETRNKTHIEYYSGIMRVRTCPAFEETETCVCVRMSSNVATVFFFFILFANTYTYMRCVYALSGILLQ